MEERADVILLRSEDAGDDRYVSAFAQAGLRAVCAPVLLFAFPHQSVLLNHLERRDQYAAIIATSPRVASALERLFADREDVAQRWNGAPAYAVGPKTARRLRDVGLEPRGTEAGDAEALASQIIEETPSALLLFLCGNRRRDTLPNRLRAADVTFEEVVVYETRLRQDLTLPLSDGSTWLVFFSPSGLEAVEQSDSVDLSAYRLAAIGPTTGGALDEAGHSVAAVAETPSPEGLLSAIQAVDEDS